MAEESEALTDGRWNYFNYFTEVEEHFQRARGTGLFLLSPLDWALVESWKNGGIPLEAVLRGIDQAFEKWHAKAKKQKLVNSVAYCSQAIQEEAQALAGNIVVRRAPVAAPFELEELQEFLTRNAAEIRPKPGFSEIADALEKLAADASEHYADLEQLEQRLTALEEKMSALARTNISDEELFQQRRELEATLRPYRSKMTADQIAMLERQYLDRRIQEKAGLPRLSLFYLK
jgi:hypothetical protein